MNLRTVTNNNVVAIDTVKRPDKAALKTDSTDKDRDANGRQEKEDQPKRRLSDEEIVQAKKVLEEFNGFKENGLVIVIEEQEPFRIFLIKGPDGQVIRRIPEHDVLQLIADKDKTTGRILDKAM
jgi:uncharacterized FlaG/YvyC family protein